MRISSRNQNENSGAKKIIKCLKNKRVPVITGYQGVSTHGAITTLGRGGSDTSAVAIAASLNAERCDIYTDVDGIYSCDPHLCDQPIKYESVTYSEMLGFARAGALVMAPSAKEIAKKYQVMLPVRSAFNSKDPGTSIGEDQSSSDFFGVACDSQQEMFALPKPDMCVKEALQMPA